MPSIGRLVQGRRNSRAISTLPLGKADVVASGRRIDYVQDILSCATDDERWVGIDHRDRIAGVSAPSVQLAGGMTSSCLASSGASGVLQLPGVRRG